MQAFVLDSWEACRRRATVALAYQGNVHPYHDIHRQYITQGPDDVNQVLLLCVAVGGILGQVPFNIPCNIPVLLVVLSMQQQ